MKATSKSPKIPIAEVVLVLIAVGLTCFVVVYVQHAKSASERLLSQADESNQTSIARPRALTVNADALPVGWEIGSMQKSQVTLKNATNTCSSEVTFGVDSASGDGSTSSKLQIKLAELRSQGYTVRALNDMNLNVQTLSGNLSLPSKSYRLTLGTQTQFQNYAFAPSENQLLSTQLTCTKQTELTAAAAALQAITVNRPLTF